MNYITLIYEYPGATNDLSETEYRALIDQHNALQDETYNSRTFVGCGELAPSNEAVTIRNRNNGFQITDGPFAESKEIFVGYYVFDTPHLDDALKLAAKIPTASNAGVEIRPIDRLEREDPVHNAVQQPNLFKPVKPVKLFAVLNYWNETLFESYTEKDIEPFMLGNMAMLNQAQRKHEYVTGDKLMSPATTTSISHKEGQKNIIDGPFSETKEVIMGFHILACKSMDDAIEYAKQIPDTQVGAVEIRPINYYAQQGANAIQWNRSS